MISGLTVLNAIARGTVAGFERGRSRRWQESARSRPDCHIAEFGSRRSRNASRDGDHSLAERAAYDRAYAQRVAASLWTETADPERSAKGADYLSVPTLLLGA